MRSFYNSSQLCIDRMSASNECTLTYGCERVAHTSTDESNSTTNIVEQRENTNHATNHISSNHQPKPQTLSRKRIAARKLPPIVLITEQNSTSTSTSYATNDFDSTVAHFTPLSSQESVPGDENDVKRKRLDIQSNGACIFSDVVDAQSSGPYISAAASSDREDPSKICGSWPSLNNAIVCGYQLIGAGKEFTASHIETKVVKTCQLIDCEQYRKILKIRERLNEAEKYWKYDDLEEMREFVLPSETEVLEDDTGRRFMFSPMRYGNLQQKVQLTECMLSELDVQPLFKQIVRAVTFCHSIGVILRDLKLRKFIFTDQQLTRLRLHDVFDLFVCENVSNDGVRDRHSCPAYVAPEILIKGPAQYAGRPADVWALGVLLYVLLFRRYPFNDATPQRLFSRILKARFCIPVDADVSFAVRALIYGMLRKEPSERPTARQLLHMPWISSGTETLSKKIRFWMTASPVVGNGSVLHASSISADSSSVASSISSAANRLHSHPSSSHRSLSAQRNNSSLSSSVRQVQQHSYQNSDELDDQVVPNIALTDDEKRELSSEGMQPNGSAGISLEQQSQRLQTLAINHTSWRMFTADTTLLG